MRSYLRNSISKLEHFFLHSEIKQIWQNKDGFLSQKALEIVVEIQESLNNKEENKDEKKNRTNAADYDDLTAVINLCLS